jgi:hypothetical protein
MKQLLAVWLLFGMIYVMIYVIACSNPEPRDNRTYMPQGIAAIPAPNNDQIAKAGDTVRTFRVARTIYYDSVVVLPYIKPTTPPPVVVDPPVSGYELVFQSGFDKMTDLTTNSGQSARGTISTTNYVTGPGSFYSIPDNVSSGTRSEVQYTYAHQLVNEGAIEYDAYYEAIVPNNLHSFQWHPNTSGASASPGLLHEGGKFTIMKYRKAGNSYIRTGVTIPSKKWTKFRWEFKFGNTGAYLRLYMDGKLIADDKSGWLGDGSGQYPKIGVNGWGTDASKSRVYYDNLKMYKKL